MGYEQGWDEGLLRKISEASGRTPEEIRSIAESYIERYSGMISADAALYMVAKELGLSLAPVMGGESQGPRIVSISKLIPGMRRARVVGRITRLYRPIRYARRDGTEGVRIEFMLSDSTGDVLTIVWDEGKVGRFSSGEFKEGDVVEIVNARIGKRMDGSKVIHVGSESTIEKIPGDHPEFPLPAHPVLEVHEVTEDTVGEEVDVRGILTVVSGEREFTRRDGSVGRMATAILSDCSMEEEIRVVFWGDAVNLLSSVPVGSKITIRACRVSLRNGEIEIHSTPRTSVEVEEEGKGGLSSDLKGRIVYVFRPSERPSGKRMVDFLLITEEGPRLVRAWGNRVDEVIGLDLPATVRISNVFWTVGGDSKIANVGDYGNIEVISQGEGRVPASAERIAYSLRYPRTWLDLSQGEGYREIRGTVVGTSGFVRVTWHCNRCGSKVRREYGVFACPNCGEVEEARPSLTFHLWVDDGAGVARVIFTGDRAEEVLGKSPGEVLEIIEQEGFPEDSMPADEVSSRLIGKEIRAGGNLRYDESSSVVVMFADYLEEADPLEESEMVISEIEGYLGGEERRPGQAGREG